MAVVMTIDLDADCARIFLFFRWNVGRVRRAAFFFCIHFFFSWLCALCSARLIFTAGTVKKLVIGGRIHRQAAA